MKLNFVISFLKVYDMTIDANDLNNIEKKYLII